MWRLRSRREAARNSSLRRRRRPPHEFRARGAHQARPQAGRSGLLRRRGLPGVLLESFAPNLRARHHHPLTAPQRAAAAGAALMALTSTGDVLLLGAVLGFAAGELTVGAA